MSKIENIGLVKIRRRLSTKVLVIFYASSEKNWLKLVSIVLIFGCKNTQIFVDFRLFDFKYHLESHKKSKMYMI